VTEPPRPAAQRKADTLAKLGQPAADVWVATASTGGQPHLVPLSLGWDGDRVILALDRASVTARNLEASGQVRLGLGPERDVVMIDAVVVSLVSTATAPPTIVDAYLDQADWDPRHAGEGYLFAILAPKRIQAWREANEIPGRTLMREGHWLV
jgi:hypothetical protein